MNRQFYKFVRDIKSEFEYVKNIRFSHYGPSCTIRVYMAENYCDYEVLETVFIKTMVEISEETNFQYFLKKYGGEPGYFYVIFYEDGIKDEELCRYESRQDFEVWELESDRSVKFRVSDYLQ